MCNLFKWQSETRDKNAGSIRLLARGYIPALTWEAAVFRVPRAAKKSSDKKLSLCFCGFIQKKLNVKFIISSIDELDLPEKAPDSNYKFKVPMETIAVEYWGKILIHVHRVRTTQKIPSPPSYCLKHHY